MSELSREQLEEIKLAAKEGAIVGAKEGVSSIKISKGSGGIMSSMLGKILSLVVVLAIIVIAVNTLNPFSKFKEQMGRESAANEHDLVLEDQGILGYTAADFAEAILGDSSKLCKLEVLKQEVSDAATLTDTGLANLKFFTKTQLITYHGTAIYTVDLSKLSKSDFVLDDEEKELVIYIPHAELEPINIQSKDIEKMTCAFL